jgi:DNA modification methylase
MLGNKMINFNDLPAKDKIYYQDDSAVIYCADNREILPLFPDKAFDLVLTDPPYGIKRDKGFGGFGGFGTPIARRRYEDDDWDNERVDIVPLLRLAVSSIIFGGNFYTDILPQSNHWIVWDKLNTMPTFGDCELAWTNLPRNSVKRYLVEYNGLIGKEVKRYHPTQKPIKLFNKILEDYSKPDDLILDPFLGSGTTAVAAKILGRKCIGIEISEKYCEIAAKRLSQSVMQLEIPKEDVKTETML